VYVLSIKSMEASMSERTSSKPGIADYVVARRKRKECFLDEIDRLIDWNPLKNFCVKRTSWWSTPLAIRPIRPFPCSRFFSSSAGTTSHQVNATWSGNPPETRLF
jgi:hypothetical protein